MFIVKTGEKFRDLYEELEKYLSPFLKGELKFKSIIVTENTFGKSDGEKIGISFEVLSFGLFIGWYSIDRARKTGVTDYLNGFIIKIDTEKRMAYVSKHFDEGVFIPCADEEDYEFFSNEATKAIKINGSKGVFDELNR